jgi:DNA-binding Xre family transcriptional regulator
MTLTFRLHEIIAANGGKPSLYALAKAAGLSYPTVYGINHNRTRGISLDVLEALADQLGVEPGDLFTRNQRKR